MKFINCLNNKKYFILFLIFGLLIFFLKAFQTRFDLLFGGYDNLYSNYILEHGYLFLKGVHNLFYGAPFNYPDLHSSAQSDVLMGLIPLYSAIRLFVQNPYSAYQILFILLCIINYVGFYYLLNCFKLKPLACAFGSFIFAFSTLRYFNFYDISSFSQFFTIISIIFITKVKKENKSIANHLYFSGASIFLLIQFYTSFALGFFAIFILILGTILSLLPKNSRDIIVDYFKNFYKYILFYALAVVLLLLPMAYQFSCIEYFTPLSTILGSITSFSVWYRSLSVLDNIFYFNLDFIGYKAHLSSMSLGIFTTLAVLWGLYKAPKLKGLLLTFVFIFFISSTTLAIYFWNTFYYFLFGIESLESINAIAFISLIIAGFA
ncbi:hypothetical protein IJ531_02085, partial [bacterium]|nr:hypothetical protein [bacterium]